MAVLEGEGTITSSVRGPEVQEVSFDSALNLAFEFVGVPHTSALRLGSWLCLFVLFRLRIY